MEKKTHKINKHRRLGKSTSIQENQVRTKNKGHIKKLAYKNCLEINTFIGERRYSEVWILIGDFESKSLNLEE